MLNFEFTLPTKFLFGRGTESLAGQELKAVGGTRALIHYGGGSAVRRGCCRSKKSAAAPFRVP